MTRPESDLEPWQWPEEHWRRLVDRVRAGPKLRPREWPGGARVAVALSFDSDHETNELRDGGKSIGRMSWGQYGARVAVPRILKLLERHGVKATFYVPAVTALIHPDEQRRIIAEGHEIGIHGWIHELNSVLPYDDERDLMLRSADTLEKICSIRPVGMRTPSWDFSWSTLAIETHALKKRVTASASQGRSARSSANGMASGISFGRPCSSGVPPSSRTRSNVRSWKAATDIGSSGNRALRPSVAIPTT